jgi:hypothetical protein
VKWIVRRYRPGWHNRGWRKAKVREFYREVAALLAGGGLLRDFDTVSGIAYIGKFGP